jgi:hypothetical protein
VVIVLNVGYLGQHAREQGSSQHTIKSPLLLDTHLGHEELRADVGQGGRGGIVFNVGYLGQHGRKQGSNQHTIKSLFCSTLI